LRLPRIGIHFGYAVPVPIASTEGLFLTNCLVEGHGGRDHDSEIWGKEASDKAEVAGGAKRLKT
jgi:hypothetical protein